MLRKMSAFALVLFVGVWIQISAAQGEIAEDIDAYDFSKIEKEPFGPFLADSGVLDLPLTRPNIQKIRDAGESLKDIQELEKTIYQVALLGTMPLHPDAFIDAFQSLQDSIAQDSYTEGGREKVIEPMDLESQNHEYVRRWKKQLSLRNIKLKEPPAVVVNWFDLKAQGRKKGYGEATIAELIAEENQTTEFIQQPMDESQVEDLAESHKKVVNWEDIPKIESKKDIIKAYKSAGEELNGLFFMWFHNEADDKNIHIPIFKTLYAKYHSAYPFYHTDTGFALAWAENLEIYRVFDALVAVHPNSGYVVRNDRAFTESEHYLAREFGHISEYQFVSLDSGSWTQFIDSHILSAETLRAQETKDALASGKKDSVSIEKAKKHMKESESSE